MTRILLVMSLLAACSSDGTEVERAKLGTISFNVPAGWHRVDGDRPGVVSAEWRPVDNTRKESILVIRSKAFAVAATSTREDLEQLLVKSHATARNVTSPTHLSTPLGKDVVRVEFDFQPPNTSQSYHRVHVLMRDDDSIVHVLYTARTPDEDLAELRFLLDSVRREQG